MVRRGVSSTRASRRWASTPEARTGCSVRGTRAAIRAWQSSRGVRATGYLDGAASGARCGRPADRERLLLLHRLVRFRRSSRPWRQRPRRRRRRSWRVLFWQSVMGSTNPAAARADATGSPGAGFAGTLAAGVGAAAGADARAEPGEVFRDCEVCPEMVVMPGPSGAGALRGDGVRVSGIARRRAVRLSGLELLAKITMRSIHACHRGSSREWEPRRGRRCQATLKTDPRRNGVC